MRYIPLLAVAVATITLLAVAALGGVTLRWPLALLIPLLALGVWDILQPSHTLRRLYPLIAHFRWFFEWLRPYMRAYLLDSDTEGRPFSHVQRALIYRRSKDIEGVHAFGTDLDVYAPRHEWINHSIAPQPTHHPGYRVLVGADSCAHPYSASILNISALSFGSLSGRAIEALNYGAAAGGFYHDTGEGGISSHHLSHGGDLVWEIGTGYFGCRTADGRFDPEEFARRAAIEQVKMIEVKLSQGAKPGQGGLLPGPKVSPEIAETRGVPVWRDVHSPPQHSAFSTPREMLLWLAELRRLSGGKPVGFKLCIGHRWEFLAIVKAMLATDITPDFIVIDGAEGGTGAAPAELSDHVGTPLREALVFVVNALTGTNLRDRIRLGVAGKIFDGHTMAANLALGADWCNSARAFMFALGCVQTKKCHTDECPTGVATQNRWREAGLVVADKGPRVEAFHRNTVAALADYVAAAGLRDPSELRPEHLRVRASENEVKSADAIYDYIEPGALLGGPRPAHYDRWWRMADPDSFLPQA
ncbi:MAG: FMN-binding glutamate synthase family protein [Allosphingosinicella sp.]|uniref:FMN-binding glutamate synthase family protein n=1 Tax=Allosphingosinicella sp. TaxID=2823234 RepID=UPI0039429D68